MINLDKLEFLNVKYISDLVDKVQYVDFLQNKPASNTLTKQAQQQIGNFGTISVAVREKEIKLENNNIEKIDILKSFIDKLMNYINTDEYPKQIKEYISESNFRTYIDIKKLLHTLISCGSYISQNGRIGPGNFIISPQKFIHYFLENDLLVDGKMGNMSIITTDLIKDKIIIGRKQNKELTAGIVLFYNKETGKYALEDIGDVNKQYHILSITSLQIERRKKLKQIERN